MRYFKETTLPGKYSREEITRDKAIGFASREEIERMEERIMRRYLMRDIEFLRIGESFVVTILSGNWVDV